VGVALSRYLRHGKYGNKTLRTLIWLHLQQRPVVAIDVDGVLANQVPHVLRRAEKELGVKMKKEDVTAWDTPVGGIPFDELIVKYLLDPNFVMTMPVMEGAVSAMEVVRKWAKIVVASSRPRETEDNSIQWLAQNFGLSRNQFKNTTSTGKSFLDADLLIDDNIGNVRSFVENGNHNLAILFSQPWNKQRDQLKELIEKKTIIVKEGWPEIEVLFRA
jgi:5'(3')-deoxyribonucleotidase